MAVQIGEVTFDEARRQLFRGEEPLHVSPKAYQLLGVLIRSRPRALSKAELQDELWPDTFVTEGNLASLISELRLALGDDARNPRYIRTVHGFGYSFEAVVVETPDLLERTGPPDSAREAIENEPGSGSGSPEPAPLETAVRNREEAEAQPGTPTRSRRARAIAAAAAVLLVLGTGTALVLSSRSTIEAGPAPAAQPMILTLAVLPFDTTAGGEADAHLGLGLADLVITRLSNVSGLTVRPTSAVRSFATRKVDSREAGRKLGVDAVLEGSVRSSDGRVRVTVQLLDVSRQRPIWAEVFDEPRSEMFAIEDRISSRVADGLLLRLSPAERSLLTKRFTQSAEAYQDYVRGRFQLLNGGASGPAEASERAASFFSRALERDPGYALAWAGLAEAHAGIASGGFGRASSHWAKSEAAARRALELEPQLVEAQIELATMKMNWNLDYAGAERDFQKILSAHPTNSRALLVYGYLLQSLGRFDESLAVRTRAMEIDPLSPACHWGIANTYLTARDWPTARRKVEQLLEMHPRHHQANIGLIRVLIAERKYEEAVHAARKLNEADSRPLNRAFLGYTLAVAGQREAALSVLRELRAAPAGDFVSPFSVAIVLAGLGDIEELLPVVEQIVEEREHAIRLATEPLFDPFRGDPRFQLLVRRAGFS